MNSKEVPITEPTTGDIPCVPRHTYSQRLGERKASRARYERREAIAGNARVVAFLVGAGVAWMAFGAHILEPWSVSIPAIVFAGLVIWHGRVNRVRIRAGRAAAFYETGLARLDGAWPGTGEPGDRFQDPNHPYALDLDLFGVGSVFERLCRARTRGGQDRLAAWLRAPAKPEEVQARQEAVAELRPALDLREDLDILGANVRAVANAAGLADWGKAERVLETRWNPWIGLVLSTLSVGTLVGWLGWDTGRAPFLAALLVQMGFAQWLAPRVKRVIAGIDRKARDLALFAAVLSRLERENFHASRLHSLCEAWNTAGRPSSEAVARLGDLVERLSWRRNQFFALFAAFGLWTTQHALACERWRATWGPAIAGWLDAVAEFEALCALSAYAYENPADSFPEVKSGGPLLDGEQLGHPLLPQDKCIRNDVHLGGEVRLLVVSGSNMSGKSTLLRTVGVNVVLALAGAPVRATRMRLSPLVVGATLRIQDSLQAGQSRFYAEISRVRQLVDLANGHPPLLFLLDEIFQGTNSHDRRLGADAVVRNLIGCGALGLITTHDLALTHIADRLAPKAANVHFEDHFENGAMTFDYRMRPGIVEKSNALALMRAVGLDVPLDGGSVDRT